MLTTEEDLFALIDNIELFVVIRSMQHIPALLFECNNIKLMCIWSFTYMCKIGFSHVIYSIENVPILFK